MTFSSNHAIQLSSNIMRWFSLIVSVLLLSSCTGRRADLADIKVGDSAPCRSGRIAVW